MLLISLLLSFPRPIDPQVGSSARPQAGQSMDRVRCVDGYRAYVFASGLASPDGLTLDGQGNLCVVEERAGRVTRLDENGGKVVLARGLHSPEGLCLGPDGLLLVVEDCAQGRLLSIDGEGEVRVLLEGLQAPEGVIFQGGCLYLTESSLQLVDRRWSARTRVRRLERTQAGWGAPRELFEGALPFSFSELALLDSGSLLLANETARALPVAGLLRLDLASGKVTPFAQGLAAVEGVGWWNGGDERVLLVAEEDVDGDGRGRLSRVVCSEGRGRRTDFALGLGTIEDVVMDARGRIFVSEDSTGLVLMLQREPMHPQPPLDPPGDDDA